MPRGFLSAFNDINPFPVSMHTKFVYVGQGELASSSSNPYCGSSWTFNLNSLYDPYNGVTPASLNTSCYNFTKLCSSTGPYQRYKVNGVLIDILLYDSKGTDSDSNELCLLMTSPGSSTTISSVLPYEIEKVPFGRVVRLADSGSQRRRITQYVPMSQIFGWTKEQFRNDKENTTGPYNNNPGTIPKLHLALANARSATTATTMLIRVKMTFFTELYDRIQDVW